MKPMKYNTQLSELVTNLFASSSAPLSFNSIQEYLEQVNLIPNKTTIYRQLDKMVKSNQLNVFESGTNKAWEKKSQEMHSHFTCSECKKIICITINPKFLLDDNMVNKFTVNSINLTGRCIECN